MHRSFALRQFTQHCVVLVVGVDRGLRVGRLEGLFQQTDFSGDARDEFVEHLYVINGFLHDLLVGGSAVETPLPVGVVVAKRQKFLVALLQGLEPCQPFIDRDLSHRSTLVAASQWPTTTMASSSKRCQAVPRRSVGGLVIGVDTDKAAQRNRLAKASGE